MNESAKPLGFDLHTRIAAALTDALIAEAKLGGFFNTFDECDEDGKPTGREMIRLDCVVDPGELADAVIRELGMTRESTIVYYPDEGVHERQHRWVTDWKADGVDT